MSSKISSLSLKNILLQEQIKDLEEIILSYQKINVVKDNYYTQARSELKSKKSKVEYNKKKIKSIMQNDNIDQYDYWTFYAMYNKLPTFQKYFFKSINKIKNIDLYHLIQNKIINPRNEHHLALISFNEKNMTDLNYVLDNYISKVHYETIKYKYM